MKRWFWHIGIATAVISLAAPGFASETEQDAPFSDLSLKIATTKQEFLRIEPIPLTIRLINATEGPASGHSALGGRKGYIEFFAVEIGQKDKKNEGTEVSRKKFPLPPAVFARVQPKTMAPSEEYRVRELLTLGLDKIFQKSGLYEILAVLHSVDHTEEIESNLLPVYLEEPSGEDMMALEYIEARTDPSSFLAGSGIFDTQDAWETLEDFVLQFGDTIYGDYATLLLGKAFFFDEQYEDAREHIRKLAEKEDFAYADEALYYIVQIEVKLGDHQAAQHYLDLLAWQYPQSRYLDEAIVNSW